jgi:hypothetical protein
MLVHSQSDDTPTNAEFYELTTIVINGIAIIK